MRINDIDYFLAVAEHGKARRAAIELGVSQPAITQGLQRLERELGFPLFERSSRGMQLTEVAKPFCDRAKVLRASLEEAIKEAADTHLGERGVLRVGVSPLYTKRLFVPAAMALRQQRPAARLRVMLNLNDSLTQALRAGDIDLAIHALPSVMPSDLHTVPLIDDALVLVVREHHPLLRQPRLGLKHLSNGQWLLPMLGVQARRQVEARLAEAGLPPPQVAVEVSNTAFGQLNHLVRHSDLIAIMSESSLNTNAGLGMVALPIAQARFARTIGVVTRKESQPSPLIQRFQELLQTVTPTAPNNRT